MTSIWRTVRVFVSSTFRDMHAERDELVRVVFPNLRARLERHRVYLVDIDLRWGITREHAENGRVLELCLEQIDYCRPFFLGIIGRRYGHDSGPLPTELLRTFGLPRDEGHRSITEWEIMHAVFGRGSKSDRALFYFREDESLDAVPEPFRADYLASDAAETDRMNQLKESIRRSGYPVTLYPAVWDATRCQLDGLQQFAAIVTEQLWSALCQDLKLQDNPPALSAPDRMIEEEEAHHRFIESRLQVFEGRDEDVRAIDDYLEDDDDRLLLVTGSAGVGKSSLLAKLCRDRSAKDELLVAHFTGASPGSAVLAEMLRRLCAILGSAYRQTDELSDDYFRLIGRFRRLLASAPLGLRTILVLDGIDQLDDMGQVDLGLWLPARLPARLKVVVSCAEDGPSQLLENLRGLEPREYRLQPLGVSAQREIIRRVPSLAAKMLDEHQVTLLLSKPDAANPLFLRIALEELRVSSSFEQLANRIADLPDGHDSVFAIFQQLLQRLEQELSPVTIQTALGILAVSRNGLTEAELSSLTDGPDLQPTLRQLRPYLHYRGAQIDFYHRAFRQAVRTRYLSSEASEREATHRLACFFLAQPNWIDDEQSRPNIRKLEELNWLLRCAEDWKQFEQTMCSIDFIQASYSAGLGPHLLLDCQVALSTWPAHQAYDPFEIPATQASAVSRRCVEGSGKQLHDLFDADEGTEDTIRTIRHLEGLIAAGTPPLLRDIPSVRVELVADFLRRHHHALTIEPASLARLAFGEGVASPLYSAAQLELTRGAGPWIEPEKRAIAPVRAACLEILSDHIFVEDISLTADGKRATVLSLDALRQYDVSRGAMLAEHLQKNSLHFEDPDRFVRMAVCRNEMTAVVAVADGTVQIFDLPGCRLRATLRGHSSSVSDVAISADGSIVASSSEDQTVRLWDLSNGRCIRILEGQGTPIKAVAISPDGNQVASGGADGTLRLWTAVDGECLRTVAAHKAPVRGLAFAATGRILFSCSEGPIRVWSSAGDQLCELTGHVGTVWDVGATHDGRLLVSCGFDATVRVWDVEAGSCLRVLRGHEGHVTGVAVSRTGRVAASASQDRTMRVWDVAGGVTQIGTGDHSEAALALVAVPRGLVSASRDGTLAYWDVKLEAPSRTFIGHSAEVGTVAVTADGTRIVSGDANGSLLVWNLLTGICLKELAQGHRLPVTAISAFPDGRFMLSAGLDGRLCLWDLMYGKLRSMIFAERHDQTCIAITADGRRFVSPGYGGSLDVRDALTGERVAHMEETKHTIHALAVSPDGRIAATGDENNAIRLWDLVACQQLGHITGHTGRGVVSLAFSVDGTLLVSGGEDRTVHVWDIADKRSLAVHHVGARVAAVSPLGPDGSFACALGDGRVLRFRLRNAPLNAPIVTAIWRFMFDPIADAISPVGGQYEENPSLYCPWCECWLPVPPTVLKSLNPSGKSLPIRCPGCDQPLRINPFTVDLRDFNGFLPRPTGATEDARPSCTVTGSSCEGGFVRLHDGRCVDGLVFLTLIDEVKDWQSQPTPSVVCVVTAKMSNEPGLLTDIGWISADGAADGVKQLAGQPAPPEAIQTHLSRAYAPDGRIAFRLLALYRLQAMLRLTALVRPDAVSELLLEVARNLGYRDLHPLGKHVTAAALEACVEVGEEMLIALHQVALGDKLEVAERWPLLVNLVKAAVRIAPHDEKVKDMFRWAIRKASPKARRYLVATLRDVKASWHYSYQRSHYRNAVPLVHDNAGWAREILQDLASSDANEAVRTLAAKFLQQAEKRDVRPWSKAHEAVELRKQAWDLVKLGRYGESLTLLTQAEKIASRHGDKYELAASLDYQGAVYRRLGQFDRALDITQQGERLFREINERRDLSQCLHYQGMILDEMKRYDEALAKYEEAGRIYLELQNRAGYARSAGNRAQIYKRLGNLERALELHKEGECIFQELNATSSLAICYAGMGTVLQEQERYVEALSFYRKARRLRDSLGVEESIDGLLSNMAKTLLHLGEPEEALQVYGELTSLARRMNDPISLHDGLRGQIRVLRKLGRNTEALTLAEDRLRMARTSGNDEQIADCLEDITSLLEDLGNDSQSLEHARELEGICRRIPRPEGVRFALWSQARLSQKAGNRSDAARIYDDLETYCRDIDDEDGLLLVQLERAELLIQDGAHDAALRLLDQIETTCRQWPLEHKFKNEALRVCLIRRAPLDEKRDNFQRATASWGEALKLAYESDNLDEAATAANRLGICHQLNGNLDQALASFREVEVLARRIKDDSRLDTALFNLATVHEERGELSLALRIYEEEGGLARRRNRREHLAFCIGNQASTLRKLGDPLKALELHREEELICRESNLEIRLQRSLNQQALAFDAIGDTENALDRLREAEQLCINIGDQYSSKGNLARQIGILERLERWNDALDCCSRHETLCRRTKDRATLRVNLRKQGQFLVRTGNLDAAVEMILRQEAECHDKKDLAETATDFQRWANQCVEKGRFDKAITLFERSEGAFALADEEKKRRGVLWQYARMLLERKEFAACVERCRALHSLSEAAGDDNDGFRAALILSLAHGNAGHVNDAVAAYAQAEQHAIALKDVKGLTIVLRSPADLLARTGRVLESLAAWEHAADVWRSLGRETERAEAMLGQARLLHRQKQLNEAWNLLSEAASVLCLSGTPSIAAEALAELATVMQDQRRKDDALRGYRQLEVWARELDLPDQRIQALTGQFAVLIDQFLDGIEGFAVMDRARELARLHEKHLKLLDGIEMLERRGREVLTEKAEYFRTLAIDDASENRDVQRFVNNLLYAQLVAGIGQDDLCFEILSKLECGGEGKAEWLVRIENLRFKVFRRQGLFTEALAAANRQTLFDLDGRSTPVALVARLKLAQIHRDLGQHDEALLQFREIARRAAEEGTSETASKATIAIAAILGLQGMTDEAQQAYIYAEEISRQSQDQLGLTHALAERAEWCLSGIRDPILSKSLAQESLQKSCATKLFDVAGRMRALLMRLDKLHG